ncbi:Fic family protein [Chitinophaga sancti]|uniref:Fic family protein n=1 Tax=Chitinophaga sancti TaxID=1004 RepID=A0A1K1QFN4_9BACT|nr:Fic family protein [Chitinophaga sancti]WQD61419.1 Fic family protein [Chitinophaga sancti]WQG93028.1 Fic family protein [Chitinophaga sancti]SFW58022.1 Fic/DOC family protein [Chitinophaga sancti]
MAKISYAQILQELQLIRKTLEQFKDGASLEMIKNALDIDIEIRTLQRRLDRLIDEGIIATSGKTKARLYRLISSQSAVKQNTGETHTTIPLSEGGKEIQEIISRPTHMRFPVGYQDEFLLFYRPNIDSYLTDEDKRKLAHLGKTARLDQPAGTYVKEILQRMLIDLSWNSSRLEGNTYSLLDTQQLIFHGKLADNKSAAEAQMILNHKDAIEFIVQTTEEIGYNRYTITNLHALLSNNLLPDPSARGRLRKALVGIGNSVFTPLGIPQRIEEMFELILEKANAIEDPFEQSFFVMVHLPYLQPFDDVNKRVSRLAANLSLNRHNLAPLAFVDVPNDLYVMGILGVYELNRVELLKDVYMWAYERSARRYGSLRQSLGEPDPFRIKYRNDIRSLVTDIVSNAISPEDAGKLIARKAAGLPEGDQSRFIETVDTELLSLHEGNFATYYVRPAEFKKWEAVWKKL